MGRVNSSELSYGVSFLRENWVTGIPQGGLAVLPSARRPVLSPAVYLQHVFGVMVSKKRALFQAVLSALSSCLGNLTWTPHFFPFA